jgi:hypothetical protein
MSPVKPSLAFIASSLLMAAGVLSLAPDASASSVFKLESSFGGTGSATGQFEGPAAMAADANTGDVFVLDTSNERVEEFEARGGSTYAAIGAITGAGGSPFEFKSDPGIAVDSSSGDLYIASGKGKKEAVYQLRPKLGHPDEYESTGVRLGGFVEGEERPAVHGLAAVSGIVYVAFGKSLAVYGASGEPKHAAVSVAPSEIQGIAVEGNEVYVATLTGLERLEVNAAYAVESTTTISAAPVGGAFTAVAPDGKGRVYADLTFAKEEGRSSVAAFGASAGAYSAPLEEFGANGVVQVSDGLVSASPEGIPSVLTSDLTDNEVHVFQHVTPEVDGCAATPTTNTASVRCTVVPDGPEAAWSLAFGPQGGALVEALKGTVAAEGAVGGELTGLEPSERYSYTVAAKNARGTATVEGAFETEPIAPSSTSSAATGVLGESATFNGAVDPEHAPAFYRFEYGSCPSPAACASSPFPDEAPTAPAGSGRQAVPVSRTVNELTPTTTYHYRLVAVGPGGEAVSGEQVFTTAASASLPEAVSGSASSVTQGGATLSGTVVGNGQATTFVWEYGTSASYGTSVYGSVQSGSPVAVQLVLAMLQPATAYHYRLVAINASGTAYGADETFTTEAFAGAPLTGLPSPPQLPGALTQVPAETVPSSAVLPSKEVKLTSAQLLARALKACRRGPRSRRAACERRARARYGKRSAKK